MPESTGTLQNLRDFTVQIRTHNQKVIVGTGIAVSNDGLIVTCRHVAELALGINRRAQVGDMVGVYFPQVRGGERKERVACVDRAFAEYDDDVLLLKLQEGPPPATLL